MDISMSSKSNKEKQQELSWDYIKTRPGVYKCLSWPDGYMIVLPYNYTEKMSNVMFVAYDYVKICRESEGHSWIYHKYVVCNDVVNLQFSN